MAAPGDDMISACGGGSGLCRSHGTSDATALASASAALIWSAHPDWTNNQVLRVMLNTIGGPVDGSKRTDAIGYGIVRPRVALTNPGDPGPADEYPLADLTAASAAPSSAPKSSEPQVRPTASSNEGNSLGLWAGVGAGALVLTGAIAAVLVARTRRRGE
jgi:subtilisin family serine protease